MVKALAFCVRQSAFKDSLHHCVRLLGKTVHLALSVISCHMTSILGTCIHVLFGQPDRVAGEMEGHIGVGGVDKQ